MRLVQRVQHTAAIAALLALTPSITHGQRLTDVVELRIHSEAAPPGATAQVKIEVTELTPITTGDSLVAFSVAEGFSVAEISGIGLGSNNSAAIGVVRDGTVELSVVSPTGSFGMSDPAITLNVRVPVDAPFGTRVPVTMARGSVRMFDLDGVSYATQIDDGNVNVENRITISDVVPGSADLPAGSVVSIFGSGFRPSTRVDFDNTLLAQVRYVSPTQVDVVLAQPARMHGMRVRAKNRDGFRVTYFSYQRTTRVAPSEDPLLRHVIPAFPLRAARAVTLRLGEATTGLALQNIETTDTMVFAELADEANVVVAKAVIPLGANRYIVRTIGEIFDVPFAGPGTVRLSSVDPVQVLGVDVDPGGAARPRLPR
jgi:hypothetical protein